MFEKKLIERVRYNIYDIVVALDSGQSVVNVLPTFSLLKC